MMWVSAICDGVVHAAHEIHIVELQAECRLLCPFRRSPRRTNSGSDRSRTGHGAVGVDPPLVTRSRSEDGTAKITLLEVDGHVQPIDISSVRAGRKWSEMAEITITFDDGAAYDLFLRRWSRPVGATFLDWVAPPKGANWLDVGCGTGAFTKLVLDVCSPAAASAVDPAPAQIDYVRKQPIAQQADFRVADAQALPFLDGSFDVVASALVINFVPDRPRALAEMRRVARAGGIIAAYVWDFAAGHSPQWPFAQGMRELGIEPPVIAGTANSTPDALLSLFVGAGLEGVATRTIDVSVVFLGFDEIWETQIPSFNPYRHIIEAQSEATRSKLKSVVRALLPNASDGSIAYSARANAVKARVPL